MVLTYLRRLLDSKPTEAMEEMDEAVLFIERLREDKAPDTVSGDATGQPEGSSFGYEKSVKLVEGLSGPVKKEEFLGNPFKLPDFSKVLLHLLSLTP